MIVVDAVLDFLLVPLAQMLCTDRVSRNIVDRIRFFGLRGADGLVVVSVNHRANADLVEDLIQEGSKLTAIKNVGTGCSRPQSLRGIFQFAQ